MIAPADAGVRARTPTVRFRTATPTAFPIDRIPTA